MGKIIAVTGCAGFIGSNLCAMLLKEGYRVVGIDNLSAGTRENIPAGVEFHETDIRSAGLNELFSGAHAVFHLAAKNCLADCLKSPVETCDINVTGTMSVLEAARLAGVGKFIYADTSAEYEGVFDFPSKVDTVSPIGVYASAKRGGALMCESYRRLYRMNITTVRYFNVYGPAQDYKRVMPPVMSAFILKLLRGEQPRIYGTGEKRRDFIYVDDVNSFHLKCVEDERTDNRTFNLGTGENYSINQIFEHIEGLLKTGIKPKYEPEMPGEAEITLADIGETLSTGWRPQTNLTTGLVKSIAYLREKFGL